MSFGWSMGDIITLSGLAVQVYTAYKDAPDEYKHISNEVKSLQILIDKAVPYCKSTSLDNNSRQEGQQALKGCNDVLEGLNSLIKKYNSSGSSRTSQVLKRIRLGTEDIASLRVRLISNTTLLNAFIQSCEIREMQDRILGLHRPTSRSSGISSASSFAGSIKTKTAYQRFCKNLFQMGITSEMIAQKEGDILNMLNQPQDIATSGGNSAQLLTPNLNQPRFRLPIDFLVGPRMLAAASAGDTKRFITTLEYIRNIDFSNDQKETALHKAVSGGHANIVELLLQKGASRQATDIDNNTPLDLATQRGELTIAVLLHEKGALIEAMGEENKNILLQLAVKNGHTGMVKLLLQKGASPQDADSDNNTPLDLATQRGDLPMAVLLHDNGALIVAMDANNKNTLLHLAIKNEHIGMVKVLLQGGASAKALDSGNRDALYLAIISGNTSLVELLREEGASRGVGLKNRSTPLHHATGNRHTSTVESPFRKDALREAKPTGSNDAWSGVNNNPSHLAAGGGRTSTEENLTNEELLLKRMDRNTRLHFAAQNGHTSEVELLLKRGFPVETKGKDKNTALHLAAENGHTSTVNLLLQNGALVGAKGKDNNTALHLAAENGHTSTVKLLLQNGALVEARDRFGNIPLHFAAWDGRTSVVELLLEKGASIEDRTFTKRTPLHLAAYGGHASTVELLLRRGARIDTRDSYNGTPMDDTRHRHVETWKILKREANKRRGSRD